MTAKQWAVGRQGRFGHNHLSSLLPPCLPSPRAILLPVPPVKWENLCNVEILTWQVTLLIPTAQLSSAQIFSLSDHVGRGWREWRWSGVKLELHKSRIIRKYPSAPRYWRHHDEPNISWTFIHHLKKKIKRERKISGKCLRKLLLVLLTTCENITGGQE